MLPDGFDKVPVMASSSGSDVSPGQRARSPRSGRVDPAWIVWLQALASDAEAALGAALAFRELDARGRDAFLDAVEQDAPRLDVPRVALFAPLLCVESDPDRRRRIQASMGDDLGKMANARPHALVGSGLQSARVCALIKPLYLDFVRVVSCRFSLDLGIAWVREDPLVHAAQAPCEGSTLDGLQLHRVPLSAVVDEIAASVVAHRRREQRLPDSFKPLLDVFDAAVVMADDDDPM